MTKNRVSHPDSEAVTTARSGGGKAGSQASRSARAVQVDPGD